MSGPTVKHIADVDGTILGALLVEPGGAIDATVLNIGGTNEGGVVRVDPVSGNSTLLGRFDYDTSGGSPTGGVFRASFGTLYGTSIYGGANGDGTVYKVNQTNGTLVALASSSTGSPEGPPVVDAAGDIFFARGGTEIAELVAGATTLTTLATIDAYGSLTVDASGNLYGTTGAGAHGYGSIFEIAAGTHTVTTLVDFDGTNGDEPSGGLVMDAAGNLYGNAHNLFEIAAGTHTFSLLANFSDTGQSELSQIAVDANGDVFGTTTSNDSIYELASGNHTITTFAANAMDVGDLTTDAAGDVYGDDGSSIYEFVVCYCAGTRILTIRGEVAVEDLAIGDLVVTSAGARRSIRWLGHRTLNCRTHPRPDEVHPMRIARHAFGVSKPSQDLYVSPAHAICVDWQGEVLIPASTLANGSTITQIEADTVTYWHVELDSHDILIANGLPAESYVDMGNRLFFLESGVVAFGASPNARLPDPRLRTQAEFCRPLVTDGPIHEAVRSELQSRAETLGWILADASLADLHLMIAGTRLNPVMRGLTARFAIPPGAADAWLVSTRSRPRDVLGSEDDRYLGVSLAALTIDDGFDEPGIIPLDDPLLSTGFHRLEEGWRWTSGQARLPAAVWGHYRDGFFLRVRLASPALPHWVMAVSAGGYPRQTHRKSGGNQRQAAI